MLLPMGETNKNEMQREERSLWAKTLKQSEKDLKGCLEFQGTELGVGMPRAERRIQAPRHEGGQTEGSPENGKGPSLTGL